MGKHRPILFSTPMVQAILAGRKTQTRRVVKPQPEVISDNSWSWAGKRPKALYNTGSILSSGKNATPKNDHSLLWACPYGKPGDVLWVRETFCYNDDDGVNDDFSYKADHPNAKGWKPSIHMPKEAARIWLEITNVRVERLQDISEEDAMAEGLIKLKASGRYVVREGDQYLGEAYFEAKNCFNSLWQSINGDESWDANPWVWVIEFKRINKPTE